MAEQSNHSIDLDIKFGFLKMIDVPRIASWATDDWSNQTLCRVNDCVVRSG